MLLGQLLLLSENTVYVWFMTSPWSCLIGAWFYHVGFLLVYGTILLKLWRYIVTITCALCEFPLRYFITLIADGCVVV